MKRCLSLALAALFLFAAARAEYWEDTTDRPVVCCDDRGGCQVLQMAMMGSFDDFDKADNLSLRVLSAAYPLLCAVTDEDFSHFIEEFGVEEARVRRNYHIALGYCLLADILLSPTLPDARATEARRVLRLFLDPTGETNGLEQMALIRASMRDELVETLAEAAELPIDFVAYLIYSDDWYTTVVLKDGHV